MRCNLLVTLLSLIVIMVACGKAPEAEPSTMVSAAMPFVRIPVADEDPADNGPDDDTVLAAIQGAMGEVKFSHFTHASSAKEGYGVPCNACHHTFADGELPDSGCTECHKLPSVDIDPAHGGPDDNLLLFGKSQNFGKIAPVFFDHFKHASRAGHKQACTSCHHMEGDLSACSECHGELGLQSDGAIVPRLKRAFHQQCKDCHQALKQTDPDSTAPTKCKECHTFKKPARLAGTLTLNRAYHLACLNCHADLLMAKAESKAPVRECDGCHKKAAPTPVVKAEPAAKPEPKTADAPTAAPTDTGAAEETEPQDKGRAKMVIDYAKKAKTGTPFDHHLHQELGEPCAKCHHEGLKDPSCRNCHKDAADAKKAFHKVCIDCHKENGVAKGCVTCHPKA